MSCPAGTYTRGSNEPEQAPTSTITIGSYLLDREPICAGTYARFLTSISPILKGVLADWVVLTADDQRQAHLPIASEGDEGVAKPNCALLPMRIVSWYGANAYSLWAHRHDWRAYRRGQAIPEALRHLPGQGGGASLHRLGSILASETEWEYAARGHRRPSMALG